MAAPKQIKRKRELDDEEEDEFTKRFLKADECMSKFITIFEKKQCF